MKVTICIGSACHVKGAPDIIKKMQDLVAEKQLETLIELAGSFCMGNCMEGVCVSLDGEFFSLIPEETTMFFETNILAKLVQNRKLQEV